MRTRPLPVTIAAILLALLSLANFLGCFCAQHPRGGSGAGLRDRAHGASPRDDWGRGLRSSHPVGGVARLAPDEHLTNFGEHAL